MRVRKTVVASQLREWGSGADVGEGGGASEGASDSASEGAREGAEDGAHNTHQQS